MSTWIVAALVGGAALAAAWFTRVTAPRRRALAAIRADLAAERPPDASVVDAIGLRAARIEVLYQLSSELLLDDRAAEAAPLLARLADDDSLVAGHRAASLLDTSERPAMERLVRRALADWPRQAPLRHAYAQALHRLGESEAALAVVTAAPVPDPDLALLRADILADTGRDDEAARIHRVVASSALDGYSQHAAQLLAAAEADDGEVVRAVAGTGALTPGAWSNHLAVGLEQRAAEPTALGPFAPIRPVGEAMEQALRLVERAPEDPLACCALAMEEMRHGDLRRAVDGFRGALEQAPHLFVTQLGLAASLQLTAQGFDRLQALPPADPAHAAWFADWAALTDLERRVASASVAPLERWLSSAGAPPLRILPLTARPDDLPTGEAMAGFVQDLYDVDPQHGWSVAQWVARAVFARMPDGDRLVVVEALEQAEASPPERRVLGAGLDELDVFFAQAVTAWLSTRHRTGEPHLDVPPALAAWFSTRR
jgi:hypothetical protein